MKLGSTRVHVLAFWALLLPAWAAAADNPPRAVQFNRDIRPILSENCYYCHGPDAKHRQADLRLDVREVALSVKAIVPGKPDDSALVQRICSTSADEMMPPPDSHKKLTPQQKDLLRRWIAEGAAYQAHWSYLPPSRPAVPTGVNAVDYLVQQRLAEVGWKPAAEADRRTLVRRLYQDLVGLPPAPERIDAFLADGRPDAYQRLVDELLASPHYGERMAIGWLDVVRFADTIGYHSDNPRNVWPYRDYVIAAFNHNKPFDKFTVEQLAGDLLPGSTREQKVGSCFNRLLLSTEEGGAQAKDYEARMLTDRVRAVGAVWLGQTLGCCQCHNHKFDPATQRDFYALGAFFADIDEPILGRREPGMALPDAQQTAELARLDAAVAGFRRQLDVSTPELAAAQKRWEAAVAEALKNEAQWTVLRPQAVASEQSAQFRVEPDAGVLVTREPRTGRDTYRVTVKTRLAGITGFRLEALGAAVLPGHGPGLAGDGNFVLNQVEVSAGASRKVALAAASATYTAPGFSAASTIECPCQAGRGWSVLGATGTENAIYFQTAQPIGRAADVAGKAAGAGCKVCKTAATSEVAGSQRSPLTPGPSPARGEGSTRVAGCNTPETTLTFTLRQVAGGDQVLGHFRLAATAKAGPVVAPPVLVPPREIVDLVKIECAQRTAPQAARLAQYYRGLAPLLAQVRMQLDRTRQARTALDARLPRCLVSVATKNVRTVRLLPRGNWMDESGPVLEPTLPAYLPGPKITGRRLTRLDLAQWLVDRGHPLTARVFVNRLWKQFFGIGICRTLDDLGSQGEWPVNPQLLDWLACEFRDSGWDVKHMVRTIVTSHTYRQSSLATAEQLARDPENRLLARQSRFRLDAELVRDNALAVAGLLSAKIGGPSVKPYQPAGYWENLNFPTREYTSDTGESQYRRGIYTWWQRSFLHPSLLAFDAPSREECAAERTRANLPQQALVLLNDPTYVEAARALAARMLKEGGRDVPARLDWGWRQALGRKPRPDELCVAGDVLKKHLALYGHDPAAAQAVIQVGLAPAPSDIPPAELAAWTSVARIILNLHETITRS